MKQSHNCAYLDEHDLCYCDEHCQYKLTTACYPLGPHICGKDQIVAMESRREADLRAVNLWA